MRNMTEAQLTKAEQITHDIEMQHVVIAGANRQLDLLYEELQRVRNEDDFDDEQTVAEQTAAGLKEDQRHDDQIFKGVDR
jgi:hypothetical protein